MQNNPKGFIVSWEPIFESEKKLLKQFSTWYRLWPLKYEVQGYALVSPIVNGRVQDHPFRRIEERQIYARK